MRTWLKITLIVLVVIVLVVGIVGFYFYNKYEEEIGVFLELRGEANELFDVGVRGPEDCSSFTECARHCASNEDSCVDFCDENSENGLCVLAKDAIDSGDLDVDNGDWREE